MNLNLNCGIYLISLKFYFGKENKQIFFYVVGQPINMFMN